MPITKLGERIIRANRVAQEVLEERRRQIGKYTEEHDDGHDTSELPNAAACYATGQRLLDEAGCDVWPWGSDDFADKVARIGERERLVKAAALIVAEIERLDRLEG
jgi:hypothetical protein